MKRFLLSAAALAAFAASAAPAGAQAIFGTDWSRNNYVQGNLGAVFDGGTHLRGVGTDGGKDAADVSPGIFGSMLVGHELGRGFALEGEGLYAQSDIHSSHPNGFLVHGESRSNETYGGLVNLNTKSRRPIASAASPSLPMWRPGWAMAASATTSRAWTSGTTG